MSYGSDVCHQSKSSKGACQYGLNACMHIWVESLGPVEEILDIHIKNEILAEPIKSWQSWKPTMRRTITVFHESRSYTQSFIYKEGIWQQFQI